MHRTSAWSYLFLLRDSSRRRGKGGKHGVIAGTIAGDNHAVRSIAWDNRCLVNVVIAVPHPVADDHRRLITLTLIEHYRRI